MSLSRLALRLAAIEALSPFAAITSGAWPTPAGPRVYDSRQQPIDGLSDLETKPILIVYTEEDMSEPYGTSKTPDNETATLVIEAMIAAKGTVEVDGPDGTTTTIGTLISPISDPQQEALLDLLEGTARRVLDARNRAPSSGLFNTAALQILHIESQPQRADDKTTRLAARTIKFRIKIRPDTWSSVPDVVALPEPLATVAAGLDPASYGAAICQTMLAQIRALQPEPLTPLEGIDVTTDLDRDPANTFPTQVETLAAPVTPTP